MCMDRCAVDIYCACVCVNEYAHELMHPKLYQPELKTCT